MGSRSLRRSAIAAIALAVTAASVALAGGSYVRPATRSERSAIVAALKLQLLPEEKKAIDARLPVGDLTLAKLDPTLRTLVVVEGRLTGYAGYPGSDCLNGAVIRVPDGHALMERLPSHHSLLTVGHDRPGLELLGRVFGLTIERPGA